MTSTPVAMTTEKFDRITIIDYESIDVLNKLPFTQSSIVDYIEDFDESIESSVAAAVDASYNNADGKKLRNSQTFFAQM